MEFGGRHLALLVFLFIATATTAAALQGPAINRKNPVFSLKQLMQFAASEYNRLNFEQGRSRSIFPCMPLYPEFRLPKAGAFVLPVVVRWKSIRMHFGKGIPWVFFIEGTVVPPLEGSPSRKIYLDDIKPADDARAIAALYSGGPETRCN